MRTHVSLNCSAVFFCLLLVPAMGKAREVPLISHTVDASFDGARSVRAADLDGDGDLDLIAIASVSDQLKWYENTAGDGSAWTGHSISTSADGASSVGAGDLDGDGDLDIYCASGAGDSVHWWENDGSPADGGWSVHGVYGGVHGAAWVDAGDMDGDGDLDLVGAAITDRAVMWWENDGTPADGIWTEYPIIEVWDGAWSTRAVDMDRDGDLDILGSAILEDMIAWWENDGTPSDGGWIPRVVDNSFTGAHGAVSGDLDGDGDMDIVGAAMTANSISWWESDGSPADGGWTLHGIDTSFAQAYDVALGDVDGDGDLDVLGAAQGDDEIAWWENDGTPGNGGWIKHVASTAFDGAVSVASADLDGDGDLDILGTAHEADVLAWWENETIHRTAFFPTQSAHLIDGSFSGDVEYSTAVVDMDLDGDLDLIAVDPTGQDIVWWESDGSPDDGGWSPHSVGMGAVLNKGAVAAADIDGDGDVDIFSSSPDNPYLSWWENDGSPADGGWTEWPVDIYLSEAVGLWVEDMDLDGRVDVVSLNAAGDFSWFVNPGLPATSWLGHGISGRSGSRIVPADGDGDGDVDIFQVADNKGIYFQESDFYPNHWPFVMHLLALTDVIPYGIDVADMDDDGDLDAIVLLADRVSWWENDGIPAPAVAGDWPEHSVGGHGGTDGGSVRAVDMDGDGDFDILAAVSSADDIIWWENDGSPLDGGWIEHVVDSDFGSPVAALAADFNRDGMVDILAAGAGNDKISWWDNRGGQFRILATSLASTTFWDSTTVAPLDFVAKHIGHPEDSSEELTSLDFLFESQPGVPMTSSQANALLNSLLVYLDDGDGNCYLGTDTQLTVVGDIQLSGGRLSIPFVDGDTNVRLDPNISRRYCLFLDGKPSASSQNPNTLRITHLSDGTLHSELSSGEDRVHDIPLRLEWAADTSTPVMTFLSTMIFSDGFESADTSAWDESSP